jgi:hypothetical protein
MGVGCSYAARFRASIVCSDNDISAKEDTVLGTPESDNLVGALRLEEKNKDGATSLGAKFSSGLLTLTLKTIFVNGLEPGDSASDSPWL